MMVELQDLEYGGPEWSEQLSVQSGKPSPRLSQSIREKEILCTSRMMRVACVMMPDGHERRLTDGEIEALTR